MIETDRLIIFSRYPEPGLTKTRLIPVLGPNGASDLHCRMVQHTLNWASRLIATLQVDVRIRYTGGNEALMVARFGSQFIYEPQGDGDLGKRLERAFHDSFQCGCRRVIAVGTDCPSLSDDLVRQAFDELQVHSSVIGPAADGGYYLIGLSVHVPSLFSGIAWGTKNVFEQTMKAAVQSNIAAAILPVLADVDRPEDLYALGPDISQVARVDEMPSCAQK